MSAGTVHLSGHPLAVAYRGEVVGWYDDTRPHPLCRLSVLLRDHQPHRLVHFRFPLGLRLVEELLAICGIIVSHETVRQWVRKFCQQFANRTRRRLPRTGDKWHLDEVVLKIAGVKHWLWRVVDQTGIVPTPNFVPWNRVWFIDEVLTTPSGSGRILFISSPRLAKNKME